MHRARLLDRFCRTGRSPTYNILKRSRYERSRLMRASAGRARVPPLSDSPDPQQFKELIARCVRSSAADCRVSRTTFYRFPHSVSTQRTAHCSVLAWVCVSIYMRVFERSGVARAARAHTGRAISSRFLHCVPTRRTHSSYNNTRAR